MVCPIGGLPKCPKFGCSGHIFGGCWLLLILMMVSTQKYVQLIIQGVSFNWYPPKSSKCFLVSKMFRTFKLRSPKIDKFE